MGRSAAFFATALIVGFSTQLAPLPVRAQTAVGFTKATADRIDQIAVDEIHGGRTPGIAIGIVEDGRLVYDRAFGFATLSPHAAMTATTEFYCGGITAEFTAAAILLLAQDGKLKLDDPVSKYVPEFHLASGVTIAQLLTQTSGLPSYVGAPGVPNDFTHTIKLASLLAAADTLKPVAAPGSAYQKNPINYMLAGLIVERASGVTLSDYLEQHIFIPLVMDHSFLAGDSGIAAAHATGYFKSAQGFTLAPVWDPAWLGGDAGLVSTIDDLAKWDIEMPVLLRVDAVRTMFTPPTTAGQTHYGMGWVVDRRAGQEFVWTDGSLPGYRALNALLPNQHVGVIVFSNADASRGVTVPEQVGARILDVLVPRSPAALDNAVVARAKEWLVRLASGRLDRSELTPEFSAVLTDDLVARENFGALGRLQTIVPLSSTIETNGDTLYVFLVRYPRGQYHYKFEVAPNGKIDGLTLVS